MKIRVQIPRAHLKAENGSWHLQLQEQKLGRSQGLTRQPETISSRYFFTECESLCFGQLERQEMLFNTALLALSILPCPLWFLEEGILLSSLG